MKFNSPHSKLQTPFELPSTVVQKSTRTDNRRRDAHSTLLSEDMGQNSHDLYRDSIVVVKKNIFPTETNQEILDPKKQDVEITDPKRDLPEREFPSQEKDDQDQTPDKIVPEEDQHYLIDEEGDIIREPTQ